MKVKGILVQEFGGPGVLQLHEIEIASPLAGQAWIRVMAIGVNFKDIYQRRGDTNYRQPLPYIPGEEASGVVEAVGHGVTSVKPGDRVAYTYQPSAYAELSVVQADRLVHIPDVLTFEQGAAWPMQGMTAHYLLHEFRKVSAGDIVLIHAAAGGMGQLLVQWAKHLGATVFGTVSSEEKAVVAMKAGADEIILYHSEQFPERVKQLTDGYGADLIIDGVGKSTLPGDLEAAAVRGTIIIYGGASGPAEPVSPEILRRRSLTLSGGKLSDFVRTRDELLLRANEVLRGITDGWLNLSINPAIPIECAANAHAMLESRNTVGKIILTTAN
jgi:NADPH:quinone reductase